ncbi:MAG: hypothetical protein V3U29_06635 [Phycisphaeraceae bacterium]
MKHLTYPIVCVLLFAGGCQFPDHPTVRVVSVSLAEQTDAGVRVELLIAVENPNSVSLPLKQNRYSLTLDQVGTFSFTDAANRTLPARGVQTLTMAAALATNGRDVTGTPYHVTGSISYEPPGEVRKLFTDAGVPLPAVQFSDSGRLE